jgi:hypothetical protein
VKKLTSTCPVVGLLRAASVGAQTITQGAPTGTLVSAFAAVPSGFVPIYTTPAKGHFVLTQAGGDNGTGCVVQIQGVAGGEVGASSQPATFGPGLLLPANSALTASSGSGALSCYIIGVLEK